MFSSVRRLSFALAAAALVAGSLAGCGMSPATADPKNDPCAPPAFPAVTPPVVADWNGAPLTIGPHTVIVLQPDPQHVKTYIAYQVEWQTPSVPVAVRVPADKLPGFIDQQSLAELAIRNPPPPPPPVVDLMDQLLQLSRAMDKNRGY